MNLAESLLNFESNSPLLMAGWALIALIVLLLGILMAEKRRAARLRRLVEYVESRVAEIMGRDTAPLAALPDEILRVKEDVETLLAELASHDGVAAALDKRGLAAGEQDSLHSAIALIGVTIERVKKAPAGSSIHRLEVALRLSAELQTTMLALRSVWAQPEAPDALGDMLRSGQLNHILTMAPLLSVYFAEDDGVALVRTAYQAAAALIEVVLAEARTAVEVVVPLTAMARNAARVEFVDQRGLSRIPAVREQVIRAAREVSDGNQLIVDCLAPGWRVGAERQRPQIVGFSRAEWIQG